MLRQSIIVIEGPIGVGKTTLAKRIAARAGHEMLLEQPEENPFLERFYADPKGAALPTQLFFLFQRARMFKSLKQGDLFGSQRFIADFMLEKDRLFAEATLDDDEFDLYEQVYSNLTIDAPSPDLVVVLQAPVDALLQRIELRGRRYEQPVSRGYLETLIDSYTRFFLAYRQAPVLIVNAERFDPVHDDAQLDQLIARMDQTRAGIHYYNPMPSDDVGDPW